MILQDKVKKILFKQLNNFWGDWNAEAIDKQISKALEQMSANYSMAATSRLFQNGSMIFNPMHTVTWAIFYTV